ncbi:inactive protein RESTRICTED TEV MOVEMENT 2-like [Phragmites australis]|uniref:inactive protein RESTRICTED TEV MOVEMENT 2-like n=1 Tax=Phragmites australis TaxID=29695 RepID=UPI002D7992F3|nr:inactive protein RESTRICTED TEV MOVEMENT 2-like [Phragmites australis]
MASRQAPAAPQQPRNGDGEFDPVYEWLDDGGSYLLRLDLPGFKKEDLRVHVDAAGCLTVLGQRAPGAGTGNALLLHKVFQLPATANLDTITGRFDGAVLTLTVPKLPQPGAVAPPPPPPPQAKEEAEVTNDKPVDQGDKAAKIAHEAESERKIEAERASLTARGKKEDEAKAEAPPPPPPSENKAQGAHRDQDEKAGADHRAKVAREAEARADHRAKVAREAASRIEEARARVAEARAVAERESKGGHWKEHAAAEGLKWAEAVGKKKEVIATAVAAFTLGVLASHRLFAKS